MLDDSKNCPLVGVVVALNILKTYSTILLQMAASNSRCRRRYNEGKKPKRYY